MALTAKGTITGNCEVQWLPFSVATDNYSTNNSLFINLATNWVGISSYAASGTSVGVMYGIAAAGTNNTVNLVTADITNTTQLYGVVCYRATA